MNIKRGLGIAFGILFAAFVGFLFLGKPIQKRIQDQLIAKAIQSVQSDLPFEIQEVSLDTLWSDIIQGKPARLTIRLKNALGSASLSGILSSQRTETGSYRTQYQPKIKIKLDLNDPKDEFEIDGKFFGDLEAHLTEIEDIGVEISSKIIQLKSLGITAKDFSLKASWIYDDENPSPWNSNFSVREILWKASQAEDAPLAQLDGLEIKSQGTVDFFPFEFSQDLKTRATAKQIAAGMGTLYFETKLTSVPLDIQLDSSTPQARITAPGLNAVVSAKKGTIDFRIQSMKKMWEWLAASLSNSLPKPKFLKWIVPTGSLRLQVEGDPQGGQIQLKVENLSAGLKSLMASIEGLNLNLPIDVKRNGDEVQVRSSGASFSIKKGSFRKVGIRIPTWKFGFEATGNPTIQPLRLAGRLTTDELPRIESPDFKIKLRKFKNQIQLPNFSLSTGMELEPVPIQKLMDLICFKSPNKNSARFPETEKAWVRIPRIQIDQDSIQLDGSLRADLFGGYVKIDHPAVFDWQTDVPESQVDIEWDKIRLEEMGPWLGVGSIQGFLRGYAKEVVLQKDLPTRYDALFEMVPTKGKKIPFSGKAMKTMIYTLVDMDGMGLPKMARDFGEWFLFGLPSQLAGGYDVTRAGVKVRLDEGSIVLETTDPEDLPVNGVYPDRKRMLIDSGMFDFVLKTSRYPAVMDASAFYKMLAVFRERFDAVTGKVKRKSEEEDEETDDEEDEENLDPDCLPSFFRSVRLPHAEHQSS
ncbi:MAG: hypothetical protein JNL01_00160 [Bdellovibrionales bacterium]|nr:hypothetical protein [Bdellovibrionales bacterium]